MLGPIGCTKATNETFNNDSWCSRDYNHDANYTRALRWSRHKSPLLAVQHQLTQTKGNLIHPRHP